LNDNVEDGIVGVLRRGFFVVVGLTSAFQPSLLQNVLLLAGWFAFN